MSKGTIYVLIDERKGTVTVGKNGGTEYTVDLMPIKMMLTPPKDNQALYEYAKKESQYVPFEFIPNGQRQL